MLRLDLNKNQQTLEPFEIDSTRQSLKVHVALPRNFWPTNGVHHDNVFTV
jgi:hypothetical protein